MFRVTLVLVILGVIGLAGFALYVGEVDALVRLFEAVGRITQSLQSG